MVREKRGGIERKTVGREGEEREGGMREREREREARQTDRQTEGDRNRETETDSSSLFCPAVPGGVRRDIAPTYHVFD